METLSEMMEPSLVLFYLAGTLTMAGGFGVVLARNIVYAAFALLIALVGTAGVFLLAFAEFLALVQILIYGGAVVIVILFGLMLTRLQDFEHLTDHRQWPVAAILGFAMFGFMVAAIGTSNVVTVERQGVDFRIIGSVLFTEWAIPFEVASLVLLLALIGAVIMVRKESEQD